MCGILGAFSGGQPLERLPLTAVDADRMRHRGPNSQGWYLDPQLVMGFRRLAIIDVAGGTQPLYSEDEQIILTINGEIYNHRKLRHELEKRHTFRSRVDGEVLIHLYEEEGPNAIKRLNGMFAFALYDRRRNRLLLGRDRAGKKPLYYFIKDKILHWASELKVLLSGQRPAIDRQALSDYLRFGYVPAPLTILSGVQKLPAASLLVAEGDAAPALTPYWRLTFKRDEYREPTRRELEQWSGSLLDSLSRAVGLRLESEVPLAFLLSGGVDSAAVFALGASALLPARAQAFTVGFDSPEVDESLVAAQVARIYGAEHRVRNVRQDQTTDLGDVLRTLEVPISTDALLPTAKVFEAVADAGITTVLTGEGSDEIFAGYSKFTAACTWLAGSDPEKHSSPLARYLAHEEFVFPGRDERIKLLGNDVDDQRFAELEGQAAELDPLSQMLFFEANLRLPDRINPRLDRLSMFYSIEARAPFMDHEFMELASRMPHRLRRSATTDKWALRHAVRNLVPPAVLKNAKAPFRAPARWFVLAPDIDQVLGMDAVAAAGLVDPAEVQRLRSRPLDLRSVRERIYSLYVLHKWFQSFYLQLPFSAGGSSELKSKVLHA